MVSYSTNMHDPLLCHITHARITDLILHNVKFTIDVIKQCLFNKWTGMLEIDGTQQEINNQTI